MYERFEPFVEYWCHIRGSKVAPARKDFHPGRVLPFIERLMIVERTPDGAFELRLVGAELEERLGGAAKEGGLESAFGEAAIAVFPTNASLVCGPVKAPSEVEDRIKPCLSADLDLVLDKPCGLAGTRRAFCLNGKTLECHFLVLPLLDTEGCPNKLLILTDFTPRYDLEGCQLIDHFGSVTDIEAVDLGVGVPAMFACLPRFELKAAAA